MNVFSRHMKASFRKHDKVFLVAGYKTSYNCRYDKRTYDIGKRFFYF